MKINKNIKIIFTGGGSGGHTMPALAMIKTVSKYFTINNIDNEILYIGSEEGVEKFIIQKNNINYIAIKTGKLRRYFSVKNFFDIFNIIMGFFQSLKIIKKFKPDLIFSTGGFVSVPPVIAGKLKKIKILIHEQTVDAGLANKIASRFADIIALSFNESLKYFKKEKCIVTGIPLRDELFNLNKDSALKKLGLDNKYPVIYFTGGGLGCHSLNTTSFEIINELIKKTNIIFQTGNALNNEDYNKMLELKNKLSSDYKKRFFVFDFIHENLPDILACTDLAISRSGAGTVNEFMALNIPAIFIPLAIATNNEQYKNAEVAVKLNGAVIINEKDLTKEALLNEINNIIFTDKLKIMKQNLIKTGFKPGNEALLKLILEMI